MQTRRTKGEGSLFRRSGKGNWTLRGKTCGRQKQFSLGTTDKKEAGIKAEMLLERLEREPSKLAKTVCGLPLTEIWRRFEAKMTCGHSQESCYRAVWRMFSESMLSQGVERSDKIKPDHLQKFVDATAKTPKPLQKNLPCAATVRRHVQDIKRIFRVAGLPIDKFKNLDLPHDNMRPIRQGFTEEELVAIEKAFGDNAVKCPCKKELHLAHVLSLNTGLRLKDVCLLRWKSVDFEEKVIDVTPHKTERYHQKVVIPINAILFDALMAQRHHACKNEYVLPALASRYLSKRSAIPQDYSHVLKSADIKTNIDGGRCRQQVLKSFHSLRHTFVSRLASAGVSTLVIQSLSGHTTMAMTEHYTHISLDAKRKALGEEMPTEKATQPTGESATKKKLDAIKTLLESKKDRTPLEEALLGLL